MTNEMTTDDFLQKFDHFTRAKGTGNVIIHPALPYNFIELTGEFVDKLRDDLSKKIMMAGTGIDELSPTDKFAIMMLQDAY